MSHEMTKRLVFLSVIGTFVAMGFMGSSILFPHPLLLVLAMSLGQGIAILALALYLFAIALDLQASGASGASFLAAAEEPPAPEAGPDEGSGTAPPAASP